MEFALGALMLITGIVASPFLSIRPIGPVQTISSALLTAIGFMLVAHSLSW